MMAALLSLIREIEIGYRRMRLAGATVRYSLCWPCSFNRCGQGHDGGCLCCRRGHV
jgi:hypothetical protein